MSLTDELFTYGLIGILLTSLVNLAISFVTLRGRGKLEKYKSYISFLETKLQKMEDFRNFLESIEPARPPLGLEASEKGVEYLDQLMKSTEKLITMWNRMKHYFSKVQVKSIEAILKERKQFEERLETLLKKGDLLSHSTEMLLEKAKINDKLTEEITFIVYYELFETVLNIQR